MAKRILLADDSLTIQKVVELTFSDSDYDLVCVGNGQKALERVWEGHPDLILADVVMPEKNGYEVCEVIKSNPATARIPVVLLSGTFEPFDRQRAERIGCDAIVSKPFDSHQLLAQVEALLARSLAAPPDASAEADSETAPRAEAEEEEPFEAGFNPDDFTGSFRVPRDPYRADLFEEEFVRGDVDYAIAAFETEHAEIARGSEPTNEVPLPREEASRDAPWLMDEGEPGAPEGTGSRPSSGLWGEGASKPEDSGAIAFELDPTAEMPRSGESGLRADEAPTSEIRLDAFALDRAGEQGVKRGAIPFEGAPGAVAEPEEISAYDAEILFDVESSAASDSREGVLSETAEEETSPKVPWGAAPEFQDIVEPPLPGAAGARDAAREDEPPVDEGTSETREDEAPVSSEEIAPTEVPATELEALAQNASIPELTDMLSSVRRADGGLSEADVDRLASRVVEKLSDRIVREIAWEVIPDMAEIVIKRRIKELEASVE